MPLSSKRVLCGANQCSRQTFKTNSALVSQMATKNLLLLNEGESGLSTVSSTEMVDAANVGLGGELDSTSGKCKQRKQLQALP
ncbi:hypothetical protein Bca4012_097032 [Brassica carinata]